MSSTIIDGKGVRLAERLGLTIVGTEGHDLKAACIACNSSDAARVHQDEGVYHCYACNKNLSAWDLCKVVLGDHDAAKRIMVDVGLFEAWGNHPNGNGSGKTGEARPQATPEEILARVAKSKNCTPEGFRRYGAVVHNGKVSFPMFGGDHKRCSHFTLDGSGGKGLYAKGKPVGVFLPCEVEGGKVESARFPDAGETWVVVEGVKDAAALSDLGVNTIGKPSNRLKKDFATLFSGVDVVIVPDADPAGILGAMEDTKLLHGVARIAALPIDSGDVRDVLAKYGPEAGAELLRKAIAEAPAVDAEGKPVEKLRFVDLIPSSKLRAMDLRQEWLIRDILIQGQSGISGGRSKTLKTSIAIDAAVSLSSATPFLGWFPVPNRKRVAFWSGESGAFVLRATEQRIAAARGLALDSFDIFWSFDLPKLSRKEHLDALRGCIIDNKIDVAFIDPLYLALLDSSNAATAGNVYAMGAVLAPLASMIQETGCTVILLHHFKKSPTEGQDEEPATLEMLSQSGLSEWARQWILLQRRAPFVGDGRHELYMRTGGSFGHAGLWGVDIDEGILDTDTLGGRKWDVRVSPIGDVRTDARREKENRKAKAAEQKDSEDRDRVLSVLRDHESGLTFRKIQPAARLGRDATERALWTLEKEGRVTACKVGTGGGKFDGFKLTNL